MWGIKRIHIVTTDLQSMKSFKKIQDILSSKEYGYNEKLRYVMKLM